MGARSRVVAGVVLFLVVAGALGVADIILGGDWPGWDEGWALIAFPLGVPLALYASAGIAKPETRAQVAATGTLAVWVWGAAVVVVWFFVGG